MVQLTREPAVGDVELKERVAGRQLHLADFGHVPGAYDLAARIGIGLDLRDDVGDLIDRSAIAGGPAAPLVTIDGTELAVGVGPLVPDGDAALL